MSGSSKTETQNGLQWIGDRWQLDGRAIQTDDEVELLCPDGHWLPVRVEQHGTSRVMLAYFDFHGIELVHLIRQSNELRWPVVRAKS